ncbi:hypothetical protein HanIR_Chr15g0733061 [Helianthus annuus]|nr:hypothetical protein HanIR_Chr15g0733061 [Helianthus annuus]
MIYCMLIWVVCMPSVHTHILVFVIYNCTHHHHDTSSKTSHLIISPQHTCATSDKKLTKLVHF